MPEPQRIQADHFPELAENGGAYALAEQIGLAETELLDTHERRTALSATPPEELVGSVTSLNAVLRGKTAGEGQIDDGQLPLLTTPALKDKEPLLLETAQAFKDILADEAFDDKAALRRAGLTLAGALNYIHPFSDGNGRTARLMQYFVEFGAERGEKLFEAETFSALGSVAVMDIDFRPSVYTTPQGEMERALDAYTSEHHSEKWGQADKRVRASMRVQAFLDAMTGRTKITTPAESRVATTQPGTFASHGRWEDRGDGFRYRVESTFGYEAAPAGTDIVTVYESQYEGMSFAAHVDPTMIPPHAQRVEVVKRDPTEGTTPLVLDRL